MKSIPKPLKNRPLETVRIENRFPKRRQAKNHRRARISLLLAGKTIK